MNKISAFLRRCLFLLLLALMVTSHGTAQRFEPRIVFASNHDGNWNGNWDIYSMDVHGNNLVQLANHPASDNNPAGSPNGRRIAFASRRGLTPDLYVMDSDGNNVVRLTQDNFDEGRSSWSPDGTKIAFTSFCKLNCDIFTVDANGANRTRLTEHEMKDVKPSWSPDGRKIAFQSQRVFEGHDIYVITDEGKNLKQLTVEGTNRMPAYSPDGTKIAFASSRDGDFNIYLMDTNGMNVVKLTASPPGTENISPSWLPSPLAVNPNGKLPTSWGVLKLTDNQ